MKISKYSTVGYKLSFYIPVNDIFNKIKIATRPDDIIGARCDIRDEIFIDGVSIWDLDFSRDTVYDQDEWSLESSTDDIVYGHRQDERFLVLGENIVKTDKIKKIDVIIRIWVRDLELLIKTSKENPQLEKIVTITGFDSNYKVLFEEVVKEKLEFEKYNIFGAAAGNSVKKKSDENVNLVVGTIAMDNFGLGGEFTYKFRIKVNDELDISGVNDENIFLTLDGITKPLNYHGNVGKEGNELKVDIRHFEKFISKLFYISIPALTKSTIVNINEDFIRSECNLEFEHYDRDGEYEILSIAPTFNIRTNLEYVKPELSNAVKIII